MRELTLKEMAPLVRRAVSRTVSNAFMRGRVPSLQDCLDDAESRIRNRLLDLNKHEQGIRRSIDDWISSAHRDISSLAQSSMKEALANQKSVEILKTATSARIQGILKEKGIAGCKVIGQVHRLKVHVPLPNDRVLIFCVRYRHMQEDLSHVSEGIDMAFTLVKLLGYETCIA